MVKFTVSQKKEKIKAKTKTKVDTPRRLLVTFFNKGTHKKRVEQEFCATLTVARNRIKNRYLPQKDNSFVGKYKDMIQLIVYYNIRGIEFLIAKEGVFINKNKKKDGNN